MTGRARARLAAVAWVVRDTFRQAMASRLFWLMLGATGLCVALCLSLGIEGEKPIRVPGEAELFGGDGRPRSGPDPSPGRLTLAFGGFRVLLFRDGEAMARFLESLFAGWVAGGIGTLLAIVWTAGFLPDFLGRRAAPLAFSKPLPRWGLLLVKELAVLAFVAFQATLFVGGTWLALGLRTGCWAAGYLWSVPLLLLHFAIIHSVSTLLAASTRNAVVSILGSVGVWSLCAAINYGRHAARTLAETAPGVAAGSAHLNAAIEVAYWLLPKPADLMLLLDRLAGPAGNLPEILDRASYSPALSIFSSLAFVAAFLGLAAWEVERIDY
ncbi:ABC-2 family transporter protein [Aquisphaera giovannonii]|uniref:ABC-2 family transporter protein n=1 Tax=Aquisphaera giovannonii TaxID=406548 RepID=A0A5B9W7D0_9BACT|nr:transcriptional regulator [Aquisphaera giovannonii]QEH35995.1 ABC-2 family transporter protein [Aquisphaera giovannonii]